MREKCAYCQQAPAREKLAEALENGEYPEQPPASPRNRRPRPMRDEEDRYTITGVAASRLTSAVWVKDGPDWTAYPMDLLTETLSRREENGRRVIDADLHPSGGQLDELKRRAGPGDVRLCPEETAAALGIDEHRSTPVDLIEINPEGAEPGLPNLLDSKSFASAARFLRTVPDLLGACSCGQEEE